MNRFDLKLATFMAMAYQLATLSTCPKRQVGCILLDSNLRIVGSGYNGVASGEVHCAGVACVCIHAEVNAIHTTPFDKLFDVAYVITTCAPCAECFGKIMTRLPAIKTIYYSEKSKNSCRMIGCDHQFIAPHTAQWPASKVGGSYQAEGTIVSEFNTKAGAKRVVFEFDAHPGMLHIFTPKQILGRNTKRLVPCFGTYNTLSSKEAITYGCEVCQLQPACCKAPSEM